MVLSHLGVGSLGFVSHRHKRVLKDAFTGSNEVNFKRLIGLCLIASSTMVVADEIAAGKALAFERKKGNCLACHQIEGGALSGTIGPPLVSMQARYADKGALRAQIADAPANNPNSLMPPFVRHGILTDKEIDLITEFVYSL